MLLPNRHGSSNEYRYGYNGMEKDDELKGEGNSYTSYFRKLDPRIGRWFSIDPVYKAHTSPYVSMSNDPITRIDPDGDNDYKINRRGKVKKIKTIEDDETHTIFGRDGNSIEVSLDFFDKTSYGKNYGKNAETGEKELQEATHYVNNDLSGMEEAYKFFAINSDVEWEYNVFTNYVTGKSVSTLTTTHDEEQIHRFGDIIYQALKMEPNFILEHSSHSHPGHYRRNGWPAFPSGFTINLEIDAKNPGDRDAYIWHKKKFGDRIPNIYNIFIPGNPKVQVFYNGEAAHVTGREDD